MSIEWPFSSSSLVPAFEALIPRDAQSTESLTVIEIVSYHVKRSEGMVLIQIQKSWYVEVFVEAGVCDARWRKVGFALLASRRTFVLGLNVHLK
jgi:hypothetical protein